jgi:hypothetical protein
MQHGPAALSGSNPKAPGSAGGYLLMFAAACYVMARCFEVGIIASAIAAQSWIVLVAPMVLVLQLPTVFCISPGNAVAYAPHMVALGLLAQLELRSWRRIALITAMIFSLIFYSFYCDPLWTMVDGSAGQSRLPCGADPPHLWTIALRAGALACCVSALPRRGAGIFAHAFPVHRARPVPRGGRSAAHGRIRIGRVHLAEHQIFLFRLRGELVSWDCPPAR